MQFYGGDWRAFEILSGLPEALSRWWVIRVKWILDTGPGFQARVLTNRKNPLHRPHANHYLNLLRNAYPQCWIAQEAIVDYPTMSRFHILVADDHNLFRKGIISALSQFRPLWSFSEATNGEQAIQYVKQGIHIDLVLLDVSMPVMNGLEACRTIKQTHPDLPVIMITQFGEHALIQHLLQQGANSFLQKDADPEEVVDAIESVIHCGKFITVQIMNALEASVGISPENKVSLDLSARDKEIIHFLCRGMSTKEIASALHLTETSIESYRKNLLQKTRTHNVAELISFSHRTGLLSPGAENRVSTKPVSVESPFGY
jgi:DNA-binding NarL/FixJ family response regulator